MDDLVKEFIDETVEMLAEIDIDLIKLETDANNRELIDKIFRLMHTIKGTCGFISLARLERTAHVAENLLDHFRSGTITPNEKLITLLFMSIDRVRYLIDEVAAKGFEPEGNDKDLNDAIEKEIDNELRAGTAQPEPQEAAEPEEAAAVEQAPAAEQAAAPEPEVTATESELPAVVQPEATASRSEQSSEYLRVPMSVLESMIDMVSELVLSRNQLLQKARMEENSSFHASFQRLNRTVSDLQDVVMKTRMQPIGNAWTKLPRIVRDLSRDLGKKITLETAGEETELDRQVLELIKDPLTHMIRNSCDHGIESPQVRVEKGKRENGTIKLSAFHEGGLIVIRIRDDGKGIDPATIGAKAVEKGLVSAEKLKTMNDKQILSFIMRAGFSTAEQVTSISGRGVGMDVVRANIEKIGGSIDIESAAGNGTTFTIQIPLTLAIISALIIELEGCRYAIPQINIQELVSLGRADKEMIEYISNKPVLRLRDKVIPLIDSSTLFRKEAEDSTAHAGKFIVVMATGSCTYGVIVDRIYDTEEVVIKSVSSVLRNTHIYSGNTILGDGQVIMILDPGAIARQFSMDRDLAQHALDAEAAAKNQMPEETMSMLVFRAGKGAPKALPIQLVSRIQVFSAEDMVRSGDKVVINFEDKIINLSYVDIAAQADKEGDVTAVILSDDRSGSVMGIIIDDLIDIAACPTEMSLVTVRDGILGSTRLRNSIIDVLDVSYFVGSSKGDWFSVMSHGMTDYVPLEDEGDLPVPAAMAQVNTRKDKRKKSLNGRPSVLLVDDSNFFRSMLKPILLSAGYAVTVAEDALQAIRYHDEGRMYDIILSDIEMPRMDGYQFVERMRNDSQWKETPFIAITSHNTQEDVRYGYEKGFNEYVGKFEKDELLALLAGMRNGGSVMAERGGAHG